MAADAIGVVPRSKYRTAARIFALASSAPAKSESSKSDMTAPPIDWAMNFKPETEEEAAQD
jgi:hypothetical protein